METITLTSDAAPDGGSGHLAAVEDVVRATSVRELPAPVVSAARQRAESFVTASHVPEVAAGLACVAEILAATWLEPGWTSRSLQRLIARVAAASGLEPNATRAGIFFRVVRDGALFELPPRVALEAQLQMLAEFAPAEEVSLWVVGDAARPELLVHTGDSPSRRARASAVEAIQTGERITGARAHLHALPVGGWEGTAGALVLRVPSESRAAALVVAADCARAVKPMVELDRFVERHAARERAIIETSERRIVRLGLDLHDGPMQDLAALAQDLRLYKQQLTPFLEAVAEREILLGRFDDLDARLLVMDSELRELARSLQAPTALNTPLSELLRRDVKRFDERAALEVRLTERGDLGDLTSTQKITLLRVVNEALNNVHEHSGATRVTVTVTGEPATLVVEVTDDGNGFDVEARLVAAAKAGRLGLVGMSERVRLLGGRFDVESQPGGPTRVRAAIPRWQPLRAPAGDDD